MHKGRNNNGMESTLSKVLQSLLGSQWTCSAGEDPGTKLDVLSPQVLSDRENP